MPTEEKDGLSSSKRSSSSRNEREDRDAKSKRRSRGSKAKKPGAVNSSHRQERKRSDGDGKAAYRKESGSPSRHSSKRRDEKSTHRKEQSGERAVAPGAQASSMSDRGSRKASGGKRPAAPGAQSSTSDRTSRKSSRSHKSTASNERSNGGNNSKRIVDDGATTEVGPDGAHVLQAMAVEDLYDDVKKEENDAKIRKLVEEEAGKQRQQMEANALIERRKMEQENERLRQVMEEQSRVHEQKKRRNKVTVIVIVILLLIAGGVGAFFGLQGGASEDQSDVGVTEMPRPYSSNSTSSPTSNPTESLDYDPPTPEECERISAGLSLVGQESMETLSAEVQFDIELADDTDLNSLLPDLQKKIEEYLVLNLIGCPGNIDQRRLREGNHAMDIAYLKPIRRLNKLRYLVARAEVTVGIKGGASCQIESPLCKNVVATFYLVLRGKEEPFRVFGLIDVALPLGNDVRPELLLDSPFDTVIVRRIDSSNPSDAPSSAPSQNESTPNPTKITSASPSEEPTTTPPPSVAPVPGSTPSPTRTPSKLPTRLPSTTPSEAPSESPSEAPSESPSKEPTTDTPTASPTPSPTTPPTLFPTTNFPSATPTAAPTMMPSISPSVCTPAWNLIGSEIADGDSGDYTGRTVALSADGLVVAIGAPYHSSIGYRFGRVLVYRRNGDGWDQIGQAIDGDGVEHTAGFYVSISDDGSVLAVSFPYANARTGYVRIYKLVASNWIQVGSTIGSEGLGDLPGYSTAISSNGSVVAIGNPTNDGAGSNAGSVRVFRLNGANEWEQLGLDIDGNTAGHQLGWIVSLSGDGLTVAAGAPDIDMFGATRVFKLNENSWVQVGSDILGDTSGADAGYSVSLSDDGNVVAVGAIYENGQAGSGRVYRLNGSNSWEQVGSVIEGEASGDLAGFDISISDDGNVVAIGSRDNDANGGNAGHVRVFKLNGSTWEQVGAAMEGAAGDQFGTSVSISGDGSTVVIGATVNFSGYARVYEFSC
ncbi:MAG: hypothetical protein SGBAC_003503 [Bacillariaceae sp.]